MQEKSFLHYVLRLNPSQVLGHMRLGFAPQFKFAEFSLGTVVEKAFCTSTVNTDSSLVRYPQKRTL